jgi:hypothetical protein
MLCPECLNKTLTKLLTRRRTGSTCGCLPVSPANYDSALYSSSICRKPCKLGLEHLPLSLKIADKNTTNHTDTWFSRWQILRVIPRCELFKRHNYSHRGQVVHRFAGSATKRHSFIAAYSIPRASGKKYSEISRKR